MSLTRRGLAALVLALLASNASAQQETFEGETSAILVEVPVTIVHDGEPVRGLDRDDFHVFDERTERPIVDFEMVDLATVSERQVDDPLVLPMGARRHFLLLFDFQFSRPAAVARAREAARELVRERLHPSDLVSVATYTHQGPRLLLGFTPDRRQVDFALAGLGLGRRPTDASDPLGLTLAEPGEIASGIDARAAEADAALSAMPGLARRIERDYAVYQVTGMTRAFTELAKVLDAADGKKHLIYLTEGFDSRLMTGGPSTDGSDISSMRGNLGNVDSRDTFGDPRVLPALDRMLHEFRRSDVTIQVVDIHGLEAADNSRRLNQQALFYIANETGGELYETYNDLEAALGEMLQRTSVTYLLTFRADELPEDGSYRRLRVKVDGLPRRARVSHRAGYSAPRPDGYRPALAHRLTAARELLAGEPSADFETSTLMIPFPRREGPARVPVVVEVDGPGLLGDVEGPTITRAEVFVYALDPAGGVVDHFAQRIDLNAYRSESLRTTGLKAVGHLELPAGPHTVRVLVRNGRTGTSSLELVPLDIPPATDDGPRLLPAFFPEDPASWVTDPKPDRAAGPDAFDPFTFDGQPYLPALRPRFESGERVPVHLVLVDPGPVERLQASTRVLDETGAPAGRATLRLDDVQTADGLARFRGSLETESLAPGRYQLEITLMSPETGASSTSTTPFAIGSPGSAPASTPPRG